MKEAIEEIIIEVALDELADQRESQDDLLVMVGLLQEPLGCLEASRPVSSG
jgi:hypothetical protein